MSGSTAAYYYRLISHGIKEYICFKNRVTQSFLEVFVNVSLDQWNNAYFY